MNPIQEFQKRAAAAGLTSEQIAAYIDDNGLEAKLAAPTPADFFAAVIAEANVEKTAESLAYTEGFLKQAADRGLSPDDAVQVAKVALASVFPAAKAEKQAAAESEAEQEKVAYFEGMFEKAASMGLNQQQTAQLIQKFATFGPMMGMAGSALSSGARMGSGMGAKLLSGLKSGAKATGLLGTGFAGGALAGGGFGGGEAAPGAAGAAGKEGLLAQIQQLIASNPEIAGALGGAGVGGLAGGLSGLPDEGDPNDPSAGESRVGQNALLGALAGGGIGAGAGHFAPDMFKRLATTPSMPS